MKWNTLGSMTFAPGVPEQSSSWYVQVFVRLWAVAHIVHLCVVTSHRLDTPWNTAAVILAFWVILQPARAGLLACMAIAQIADLIVEMPISPDHWTLLGLGNLAILCYFLVRRECSLSVVGQALPALRVIVLVTYAAAALAKYNTTFLDPVRSCATFIAHRASFGLVDGVVNDWTWPVSVIAIETAIPILLTLPWTRRHGVRVGLAFHFVLSASPVFGVIDYTAAIFAFFFIFLSRDDANRMLDWVRRLTAWSSVIRDIRRHPLIATVLAFAVLGLSGHIVSERVGSGVMYTVVQLYLLTLLLGALLSWVSPSPSGMFGKPGLVTLPVIALSMLWVVSPYLGSRTTGVFTMFSNLQTERGVENHLILPNVHLTSWQEDLVVIHSSNNSSVDAGASRGLAVPLLQLRTMATSDPGLEVEGSLGGVLVSYGPGAGQEPLTAPSYWESKFLWFRPVPVGDHPFCSNS